MSDNADLPAAQQEQMARMLLDFRKRNRHERAAILDIAEQYEERFPGLHGRLKRVEAELNGRPALVI